MYLLHTKDSSQDICTNVSILIISAAMYVQSDIEPIDRINFLSM